jgi:hypothetical protein
MDEEDELEQWELEGYSHPTLRICLECREWWNIKEDSCECGRCDDCCDCSPELDNLLPFKP